VSIGVPDQRVLMAVRQQSVHFGAIAVIQFQFQCTWSYSHIINAMCETSRGTYFTIALNERHFKSSLATRAQPTNQWCRHSGVGWWCLICYPERASPANYAKMVWPAATHRPEDSIVEGYGLEIYMFHRLFPLATFSLR
jgi:hypothetical protein